MDNALRTRGLLSDNAYYGRLPAMEESLHPEGVTAAPPRWHYKATAGNSVPSAAQVMKTPQGEVSSRNPSFPAAE